jgi:hypothetical protein
VGHAGKQGSQGNKPEFPQRRNRELPPEPGSGPPDRMADTDRQHDDRTGFESGNVCREQRKSPKVRQSFWSDSIPIKCADGKWRRVPGRVEIEPLLFPLADGRQPNRTAILRAVGNMIVPALAAEFIKAFMEVQND